ncbi:MAG: peptidyl-prolyl cis-trans isomerase [Archangium sp.]|nr:peptidyl-prolyl cis-trans isomerase [Archangium sp.]MDP3153243.1 peptidyl-prolyl cis-trans isomerase [Archangium sp.]MDP3570277.1 peptidyl-prolyl cis-trans isomerase [Archangium sp.]
MLRTSALACLLILGACTQQQKPRQDPAVVATVNGEVLKRVDFERLLSREAQAMEGNGPRTPEQVEPYKQALLETLIDRALLLQAAASAGVTVTTEEVDRRVLALSSEYPAGTFDEALAKSQTSRAALTRSTREQLTIEKLLTSEVHSRVAVTEDQIRLYYEEHQADFTEPEQVHAQQIVVKGLDEAKRVQQQLWQGKKFPDLARRYSLSPDARVGGDLGFFARGTMPPTFDEVVFKLNVGGTSEVVSTEYGFHLFRVLEKKPGRKRELGEVRSLIEERMLSSLRSDAQRAYVAALRAKAAIVINDESLSLVSGRAAPGQSVEP